MFPRAGIGIGIAAAIKLVPAIFIVLLLVTSRTRDALIAAVTFGCCGLLGFLVDPSASRLYWTRLFDDSNRIGATGAGRRRSPLVKFEQP